MTPLPHCREPPMPKPGTRVWSLLAPRSLMMIVVMLTFMVSDGGPSSPHFFD